MVGQAPTSESVHRLAKGEGEVQWPRFGDDALDFGRGNRVTSPDPNPDRVPIGGNDKGAATQLRPERSKYWLRADAESDGTNVPVIQWVPQLAGVDRLAGKKLLHGLHASPFGITRGAIGLSSVLGRDCLHEAI
jgi:hypothetical protein